MRTDSVSIPSYETRVPADGTSCVETNISNEISLREDVPMATDVAVGVDAAGFSAEKDDAISDLPCVEAEDGTNANNITNNTSCL